MRFLVNGGKEMTDYSFAKTTDFSYETAIEKVKAALEEIAKEVSAKLRSAIENV